jgi:hypothetical protein
VIVRGCESDSANTTFYQHVCFVFVGKSRYYPLVKHVPAHEWWLASAIHLPPGNPKRVIRVGRKAKLLLTLSIIIIITSLLAALILA